MKQQKSKILTLTLASVLGAVALGGGVVSALADETTNSTAYTYTAAQVFSTTNATIGLDTPTVSFALKNEGSFTLSQRNLAWKWFEKKADANYNGSYLHFQLAFADVNFSEVTVLLETAMASANEDKKAINTITFTNDNGTVYAAVNKAEDAPANAGVAVDVAPILNSQGTETVERPFTISLNQDGTSYGEYNVVLTDSATKSTPIGTFTNVGAAYGKYASSSATTPLTPFKVSVKVPDADNDATTAETSVIKVLDINDQSFALNADKKIEDTAAPVLVVNDEITSLPLGSVFSVDYACVDVLDKDVSKTVQYAQFNPTIADDNRVYYDLSSTLYFTDTKYVDEQSGEEKTVFSNVAEYGYDSDGDTVNDSGREFLSVKISLSDEVYKGDDKAVYYLSWYAAETVKPGTSQTDFIVLDQNKQGATYTFLDKTNGKNVVNDNLDGDTTNVQRSAAVVKYQGFVDTAAKGLKAGSATNFYLPSMIDLFYDDGSYRNLKFTISYKSTNSSSANTRTSLSFSNLQFPVSKSGDYRFKVFAEDKAGNGMMYYDENGKLSKVSTSNVWEIEEIPYFSFSIAETSLSVEDKVSTRKDSVAVGETFDDFSPNVLGDNASEVKGDVAAKLYRIDFDRFKAVFPDVNLSQSTLSSITYEKITEEVKKANYAAATDYVDLYMDVYVGLLADAMTGVEKADLLAEAEQIFVEILPYNDKINEKDHAEEYKKNNAYHWNAEKQTFVAAKETDVYLILGVYTDTLIPSLKTCAYTVVSVEAENDVLPGETEWLKNNIVSVILFGIAGVMLILIVVVLLIKPSDETLEDVDQKANEKKEKKAKKSKE